MTNLPAAILHRTEADLVRQRVSELGVPDRAGRLLDLSRDAVAALGANAGGPARVGAHADLALPLWRDLREEVREDVRRAGAFRPVHDHDVGGGRVSGLAFALAIAGSFHFVIFPRKISARTGPVNFSSAFTPGML